MARRVSDYRIRRIADRGNEEDGLDSRARGDRFYRNRRSADRGNEKVDRDPGIIYDYPPAYDEYEDEEWYYWMTGAGVTYDPTGKKKHKVSYDDVNIYQTVDPNVAKFFHIDPNVKRSFLVLIKKDVEKVTHHDDLFDKSAIKEFVFANKLPLVTTFSRETATLIFESPIKKHVLLFATSKGSTKAAQTFVDAAKLFKGKLIFVFVDLDNEDVEKTEIGGVSGLVPLVVNGNRVDIPFDPGDFARQNSRTSFFEEGENDADMVPVDIEPEP